MSKYMLSSHTHKLEFSQWMPVPLEKVFGFFSNEQNLSLITPPWLNFIVLSKSTPELRSGTLIDYKLQFRGVPLLWQARIEEWMPNVKFVDQQNRGPFAFWSHLHTFEEKAGGTQMGDIVSYRLYGGRLGDLLLGNFIKKDLLSIFKYRKEVIDSIFAL